MEVIDKVALLYLNGKKILSSRSKGKDTYYLPGGKREGNETDIETLIREIKEELSVDIIPETAELYGIFEASFMTVFDLYVPLRTGRRSRSDMSLLARNMGLCLR